MSAILNIIKQVLYRQRFGLISVAYGFFLAVCWQVYKRTIGLPLLIMTYRGTRFLLRPNCVTSSRFVYEACPDAHFVDVLAAFVDPDTIFVDVGANVGLYSVLLCRDFQRGVLFEPNPYAARAARHNLALNDAADRFQVIEAAAGDQDGTVKFPVMTSYDTQARVGGEGPTGEMRDVPVIRLDKFLSAGTPFVVKIDAEGYDAEIIAGLKELFANRSVKLCLFECNTDEILTKVMRVVSSSGYVIMDGERAVDQGSFSRSRDLFIVNPDFLAVYKKAFQGTQE